MAKRLTKDEFISRAKAVHGDKYDYSNVEYVNSQTKVCVVCPKHGEFEVIPANHLRGYSCYWCSVENSRKLIHGVGINDVLLSTKTKCFEIWSHILQRCYSKKNQKKHPTYKDVSVCEDWKIFSNFKKWYDENYIDGYDIDKDILSNGRKIYSPETCCFVPHEINSLFLRSGGNKYYSGVCYIKRLNAYRVQTNRGGKQIRYGKFKTAEEAHLEYKRSKEEYIKKIATTYYNRGEITKRVYDAMMKYEVVSEIP